MLWVDHGLDPNAFLSAPPSVQQAALERINERQEQRNKEKVARDDAEAFARMHEALKRGG